MSVRRSMPKGRVQQISFKPEGGSVSGSKGANGMACPPKLPAKSMIKDKCPGKESIDKGWERKRRKRSRYKPPFVPDNQALMNDLVLTSLFGYLRGKDLKSCRLVCKKWNIQSLPFARSRFTVTIRGIDAYTFVKLIQGNTLGIPFGKFHLNSFNTTRRVGTKFLQLCGESAKEIILGGSEAFTVESISVLLQSFPNLQSFTLPRSMYFKDSSIVKLFPGNIRPKLTFLKSLNVTKFYSESITKKCPTFYEELFEASENIATLDLTPFSSELSMKILEIIGKPGRRSRIQKLIIQDITTKMLDFLVGMARRGLELKQLDCGFNESNANSVDWFQLIKCFKNSLISLKLNECFPNPKSIIKFERMPKLKELQLWKNIPNNLNPGSENFNNIFPILENLSLLLREKTEFYDFFSGDEAYPCPTITSLQIPTIPMKIENLNRILTVLPNLKALKCEIREGEVMSGIWTHMTQLEDLDITGTLGPTENVDSFFTGIPVEEIRRMDTNNFLDSLQQQNLENRRERILMETNKYNTLPSIRNLTNLRSLKLNFRTYGFPYCGITRRNRLTDFSGYLGLCSLKSLGHLCIHSSDISRTCADILTEDLDLHTWEFRLTVPPGYSSSMRGRRPRVYVIKSE